MLTALQTETNNSKGMPGYQHSRCIFYFIYWLHDLNNITVENKGVQVYVPATPGLADRGKSVPKHASSL